MTRYARLTMATALLAILAAPAYAADTVVTPPAAPVSPSVPVVKAVEPMSVKDALAETTTGAIDGKVMPLTETKSGSDPVVKPEDDKKIETGKKGALIEKPADKTDLKHHDTVKKDEKKIEHAVPETGKR